MSENAISSQPSDVGSSDRSSSRAIYRDGAKIRRCLVDPNPADTYSQGKPRRLLGGDRRCGACSDDLSRARSLRCSLWSIPRPVPRAHARPGMDVEDVAALESNPAARPWAWPSPWSFQPILPSRSDWRRRCSDPTMMAKKKPRLCGAGRANRPGGGYCRLPCQRTPHCSSPIWQPACD
jgi:hypothetical protein